jgi:hypothetical protein
MKKIIIILFFSLTVLLVWSCKKFLNVIPQTGQLTDADFFKTKSDFNSYVFGAYAELAGGFDGGGITNCILTTGYITQDLIAGDEMPKPLAAFMSPSNADFQNYWVMFYKVSSRANLILSKLELAPISDADKTIFEGEAKFLRGFSYFNLARAFGNVPVILEPFEISQNNVECTPEAQVWAQAIQDLTEASEKLPTRAAWGSDNLGRATKGTALAYLANAYMYTKDWANAEKASTDLIALSEFELLQDVRDVFSENTKNNKESLFEIQYRNTSDGNIVWSGQPNTGSVLAEWTAPRNIGNEYAQAGGWGETIASKKLADSYDPADDRRKKLIKRPGEKYKGEKMKDTLLIPLDVPQANSAFSTKYWLGPQLNPDVTYLGGQNIPVMRYAEFLLNYAEILFENGKTNEAYTQLNLVRQRALLPGRPASAARAVFITDVMNERRWELNFEPNIWFHYVRTETAADFLLTEHGVTMNPAWNKLPVPQPDRDQNPKLCQNPGY